ncbi:MULTISPECIES: TlpA disulfide reductase family protein [unclassified Micromonospora]|uniref:TlpA family protein disulfide reductase n=1 Tax=unclassified Micromonospora TaxID=2617518 RepID=UPI0022B602F4|nr:MULTISPECIES: TlpA disulfide reductase family protein [unclassified Micromonospora]MCZ7421468.1 TlpA disulfide reductase family protein [Verrucosispora sp. WMMA2121]WBB93850.1 TlpA disulfide reductase family protein [Verrucosispora sp. WMMC514]
MGAGRLAAGLLATATAAVVLTGCTADGRESACDSAGGIVECAPEQRSAAPQIAGELLAGGSYDVADQRGNVVVVNFWGSWCAPCRAEADDLENTYQATKDSGVTFLGINVQDSRDKAIAFEEGRVSYPSIFDPGSRLALDMDIPPNTIPATVVLDREGRIATVIRAAVRQDGLQPIVERIAAETPAPAGQR